MLEKDALRDVYSKGSWWPTSVSLGFNEHYKRRSDPRSASISGSNGATKFSAAVGGAHTKGSGGVDAHGTSAGLTGGYMYQGTTDDYLNDLELDLSADTSHRAKRGSILSSITNAIGRFRGSGGRIVQNKDEAAGRKYRDSVDGTYGSPGRKTYELPDFSQRKNETDGAGSPFVSVQHRDSGDGGDGGSSSKGKGVGTVRSAVGGVGNPLGAAGAIGLHAATIRNSGSGSAAPAAFPSQTSLNGVSMIICIKHDYMYTKL